MLNKVLIFCLIYSSRAFNIMNNHLSRLIGTALISSTISNNVLDVDKISQKTSDITNYHNLNQHVSNTKIVVEHNNIYLYGTISFESCEALRNKINELEFNANVFRISYGIEPPPINIHIQSYGGSLMNTFYVVDLIENLKTQVNTYVDGYSASAASLINVVGNKRYMTKNSMMLIHQLYSSNEGKYSELSDDNENMELLMSKIRNIYLRKTKMTPDMLDDLLKHDLWLDAKTCKKYGLIDEII